MLLDHFCPMHARIDQAGCFTSVGPTLQRVLPEGWQGRNLSDLVTFQSPSGIHTGLDLLRMGPVRVTGHLRSASDLRLKGGWVPDGVGGVLNLSFGISVCDAVRRFNLTEADFAPTDQTIELLFLAEANAMAMGSALDMTLRLQQARQEAEERSVTDPLTGLANRRAFDLALAHRLQQASPFALAIMDLDRFKLVNDTLGHGAGDQVLVRVADILRNSVRRGDLVARLGGDEFVLMLEDCASPTVLGARFTRLIAKISTPDTYEGQPYHVGASIGWIAVNQPQNCRADDLMRHADSALYAAKSGGRGCHRQYHVS